MSQERLCELSGVDRQAINRIELGRHATASTRCTASPGH
ncbi:helix-turn-helix transcriptional regulator [Streptomyces cavourensis]|nr:MULTISPECIES: helix-turn-helix transcriptional regulator [Streptomyces]WAE70340.1 helix-turn-helix transcriptional regulator [Streptomyces cavourensis]